MPDITPTFLDHLDALAKDATPGPRECRPAKRRDYTSIITVGDLRNGPGWSEATAIPMNDATFIAACSPDVITALTSALREAWGENARLRALVPSDRVVSIIDAAHRDDGGDSGYLGEVSQWLARVEAKGDSDV